MRITAEPRSDQWNADDFIGGPRTFTIAGVKTGTAEQKYDINLVEGVGRAWRPPLTILRVLLALWGDDAAVWEGRQVTLYRDASVRFGKEVWGGIRISHMSNIGGKTQKVPVTLSRGKRGLYTVEPLPDVTPDAPRDWVTEATTLTSLDDVRALYMEAQASGATPETLTKIQEQAARFNNQEEQA